MRLFRRGDSASTLDLLVVGLGNPGREHALDRHNAGWMVADELARRHDGSFRSKFSGQLAEVRLDGLRLGLLKPETYMNDSGRSLSAAARFFKADPDGIAVVHDDVDLEPGRLQVRLGGGMIICPDAEPDDGLFDVLTIGDLTKRDLLVTLPKTYRGRHLPHPKAELLRGAVVSVDADARDRARGDGRGGRRGRGWRP